MKYTTVSIPKGLADDVTKLMEEVGYWPEYQRVCPGSPHREAAHGAHRWGGRAMREEKIDGVLVRIHKNGWTVIKPNEHRADGSIASKGTIQGYGDGWKKYIQPGTPVVNIRSIPEDKIVRWAFQSPMVDPDIKGIRGAKVERDVGSFGVEEFQLVEYMHPSIKAAALLGNLSFVSVEEYCLLAREYGATVYNYGDEVNG